jgi:CRISPR-associated protein Cmr5
MAIANRAATPTNTAPLTLDQQRAADAWQCAQAQSQSKEYVNLAKGLPALIMNSGLLQVMAFLEEKGPKQQHCSVVARDLRAWLRRRFPEVPEDFAGFMRALMNADSSKFQAITAESLAWLRWLRQLAAAISR